MNLTTNSPSRQSDSPIPSFAVGQPFNPYKLFTGLFIPEALAKYSGISPTAKLAYGRLARYGGENGKAFPAVGTLAVEIGVKERRARLCLAELESAQLIRRELQDGRTTNYVFLWHPLFSGETPRQENAGVVVEPRQDSAAHPGNIMLPPRQDSAAIRESLRESDEESQLFLVEPQASATKSPEGLTPQQETWFAEFWAEYWRLDAKKAARRAFAKQVRTLARFQQVMAAIKAQKPEMIARERKMRPHAATWLNGERWEDERSSSTATGSATSREQRKQAAIDSDWEAIANGTR